MKMTLSQAIIEPTWVHEIRKTVDGMSEMGWKGSNALKMFFISHIFNDTFVINSKNTLKALAHLHFTVNTKRFFFQLRQTPCIVNLYNDWQIRNPGNGIDKKSPICPMPHNNKRFNTKLATERILAEYVIRFLKGRLLWLRSIRNKLTSDKESMMRILKLIDFSVIIHNLMIPEDDTVDLL